MIIYLYLDLIPAYFSVLSYFYLGIPKPLHNSFYSNPSTQYTLWCYLHSGYLILALLGFQFLDFRLKPFVDPKPVELWESAIPRFFQFYSYNQTSRLWENFRGIQLSHSMTGLGSTNDLIWKYENWKPKSANIK